MYFSGNPFEKRATEYLKDGPAFLGIVSPEPLTTFFEDPAQQGVLFDRLVTVIGAPGSGKTTLAKLFQFDNLMTVIRGPQEPYKPLYDALRRCKVIQIVSEVNRPSIVGCRLPMEAEYRDFWELPYGVEVKLGLMSSLLQARAVISWLRLIQAENYALEDITIVAKDDATAALAQIGGEHPLDILEKAKSVELAIYRISSALLPPAQENLSQVALEPYHPFSVIRAFECAVPGKEFSAVPLVVMDDAHTLHAEQLARLLGWLARRELPVARWVQMRYDALSDREALYGQTDMSARVEGAAAIPMTSRGRETTDIWMQPDQKRGTKRLNFRKMARDMANRYLRLMPVFARRELRDLNSLLSDEPKPLSTAQRESMLRENEAFARENNISRARVQELTEKVYGVVDDLASEDIRVAMLGILLRRYVNRIPQVSFLEYESLEPSRPLAVDGSLADAARIQLLNRFDRPYYFGVDTMADASSENAEQFLNLAAPVVANLETLLIKNERLDVLSAQEQHDLLSQSARDRIARWNFPESQRVRVLTEIIATACRHRTLQDTAPLGAGANAVGIMESDFAQVTTKYPEFARVLKYAVAYNALSIKRNHQTKDRDWCLIELSGVLCIRHKLTLKRGGFVDTLSLRELVAQVALEH